MGNTNIKMAAQNPRVKFEICELSAPHCGEWFVLWP